MFIDLSVVNRLDAYVLIEVSFFSKKHISAFRTLLKKSCLAGVILEKQAAPLGSTKSLKEPND